MRVEVEEAQKDNSLMNQFVQENMGLVRLAIKQLGLSHFNEDYLQEGCLGLVNAAKRFNSDYGLEFSTFAIHWIQGCVKRYLRDYESTTITGVKVSRGYKDIFFGANTLSEKGMSDEEICRQLNITSEKLNDVRTAMQCCAYLDAKFDENSKGDEARCLHEIIPSGMDIEEDITDKLYKREFMIYLFDQLTDRQADVLLLHLNGLTQTVIGKRLNISQVQVSRTLKKVIEIGKQITKGEKTMGKMKITEEQLFEECRTHGTTDEALYNIACKYNMTPGSVKFRMYDWRIKDKLKCEAKENASEIMAENNQPEPDTKTVSAPKSKSALLRVKTWEGKECTYTFDNGKLVISCNVEPSAMVAVGDYETMLREIQELLSIKEAG